MTLWPRYGENYENFRVNILQHDSPRHLPLLTMDLRNSIFSEPRGEKGWMVGDGGPHRFPPVWKLMK